MRTIFSTTMRVGKGTVLVVGLAAILAAVMGAASMALAANGKPLILGKSNLATKITALTGRVANGAALLVSNPSGGPALDLRVKAGKAPMKVNSQAEVANLNAQFAGTADDAVHADTADSATNADSATSAQNAANADTLDGKDIGELPGTVAQTVAIVGGISTAPPFGTLGFYGPTAEVTTTSSTQRLVGVVSAPLKVVESPDTGNPLEFTYGLCYRKAGTTNPLIPFYGGVNIARGTATTTPVSWTAAQTKAPGFADTLEVGFCARNGSNHLQTLSGVGSASGWIEVVNPTP